MPVQGLTGLRSMENRLKGSLLCASRCYVICKERTFQTVYIFLKGELHHICKSPFSFK